MISRKILCQFAARHFSSAPALLSNIGRQGVVYDPATTQVQWHNPYQPPGPQAKPPSKHTAQPTDTYTLTVKGPRGQLERPLPPFVRLTTLEATSPGTTTTSIKVSVDFQDVKAQRAMWGTTRAHLANMIRGVTDGWKASLKLVGVGYRAAVANNAVELKLGYANTLSIPIPAGVTAQCPQPDLILLEGISKEVVSQYAATIRSHKPPEPYNQKGIFVNDETIAKKAKKRS